MMTPSSGGPATPEPNGPPDMTPPPLTDQPDPIVSVQRPSPIRKRVDLRLVMGIAAGAGLFFAGIAVGIMLGGDEGGGGDDDLFEAVKEACATGSSDIRIGDGGDTLSIDRAGAAEMPGATAQQLECLFTELELPDAIVNHINATRALDGYQEDSFDDLALAWTYHPDDGLNMTITRTA